MKFSEIISQEAFPVIAIDNFGIIYFVNDMFEREYGWASDDLIGKLITMIMPSHMRDAHNFGFSRFLVSEQPRILDKRLRLPVSCKDGTTVEAEHYITGRKVKDSWQFVATITPIRQIDSVDRPR